MEIVSRDSFEEWKHHPVTKRLMKMLNSDRETMKEGLISSSYDSEEEVKGRCRAIAIILDLQYEDLFEVEPQRKVLDNE